MPVVPSIDDIIADHNLTSDQKFLLIVLGRHAHADGTGAYPSLRRLAALTSFSLSHVCTLLPALEQTGYLTIERFKGPKGVNAYLLHAPQVLRSTEHLSTERVLTVHRSGESEVQAEEKNPVRVQEKELHAKVLRSTEQHGDRETLSPKAARWLEVNGSPGGIASQACGLDAAAALPPSPSAPEPAAALPPHDPPAPRTKTPRAPALYFQGKLCPGGHDDGTGHTLRRVKNGNCTECDVARTRAKRQAAAAARNAQRVKPARQVIDLAAHRQRQGG